MYMDVMTCHDVIFFCRSQWKVPCHRNLTTGSTWKSRLSSVPAQIASAKPWKWMKMAVIKGFPLPLILTAKQHQGSNHYKWRMGESWGIGLAARNSVIHLSSAIPMLLCAQQSLAHFKDFEDNENPWTGIQILSLKTNSTSVQHKDHKEKVRNHIKYIAFPLILW